MVLLHVVDLDPELPALRPLGGFFVLRPAGVPPRPLPTLAEVYENRTWDVYRDPLTFRVRKVGRALRTPEERVAASIAQQGLAARLWSVTLGCAVLYGRIPGLDPRSLRWDPDGSAPDDLWPAGIRPVPADAASLAETVLDAHLEPLAAALRARHRLAPGLLRGNAASALAGASRQLQEWARAHGRPDAAARARALTAGLFTHPLLAPTGTLTEPGAAFRRRSCCLYYRVPGGGVCGDCCFTRPPGPSAHGRSG
ncbi:(2Fe-2S)-binding protein [Streptomyces antibioticus]|uniref:(2Fe-2S)-binding protein n=1 Tax=Streptomyces antibioticus TaxID=1890 RepID=UPI003D72117A